MEKYSFEEIAAMKAVILKSSEGLNFSFRNFEGHNPGKHILDYVKHCLKGKKPLSVIMEETMFHEIDPGKPTGEEKVNEDVDPEILLREAYESISEKPQKMFRAFLLRKADSTLTIGIIRKALEIFQNGRQNSKINLFLPMVLVGIGKDALSYSIETAEGLVKEALKMRRTYSFGKRDIFMDEMLIQKAVKNLPPSHPLVKKAVRFYFKIGNFDISADLAEFTKNKKFLIEISERAFARNWEGKITSLTCAIRCAFAANNFERITAMINAHLKEVLQDKTSIEKGAIIDVLVLLAPYDPRFCVVIVEWLKIYSEQLEALIRSNIENEKDENFESSFSLKCLHDEEREIEQIFIIGVSFLAYEVYKLGVKKKGND